mgnify:FL=1
METNNKTTFTPSHWKEKLVRFAQITFGIVTVLILIGLFVKHAKGDQVDLVMKELEATYTTASESLTEAKAAEFRAVTAREKAAKTFCKVAESLAAYKEAKGVEPQSKNRPECASF